MGPHECDKFVAHCFSCDESDALHHRAKQWKDWRRSRSTPGTIEPLRPGPHRLQTAPALAVLLESHSAIEPGPAPPTSAGVVPCTFLERRVGDWRRLLLRLGLAVTLRFR